MTAIKPVATMARLAVGEAAIVGPCDSSAVRHAFARLAGEFTYAPRLLVDPKAATAERVYYVERIS